MKNTNVASFLATMMGLVNCLILANEILEDRVRMRNEFIGRSFVYSSGSLHALLVKSRGKAPKPS